MAWVSGDAGSRNALSNIVAIRYMWPFELKFITVKQSYKFRVSVALAISSAQ